MKSPFTSFHLLLAAPLVLVACGGGEPEPADTTTAGGSGTETVADNPGPEAPQAAAPLADATADTPVMVAADGSAAKVYLTGSDQMKYNLTEIAVPAGAEVTVTLVHVGKMPVTAMGHNVVFLKAGTDTQKFSTAAMTEGKDNDYIPPSMADQVIANTKMIGGGETTTVTFTAPAAGSYDFICTFPGHSMLMRGKLVVS